MSADPTATEVAEVVRDLTLPLLLRRNAEEFGALPALTAGDVTLTWAQLRADALAAARGLRALGLRRGDRMMIMMSPRVEHWVVDLGAAHLAAIGCTAYQTLSAEQIGYVAHHSGATVVVLEGADEVRRWAPALDALPALRAVVVVDPAAVPAGDGRFTSWADLLDTGRRLHAADPAVIEDTWPTITPDDPLCMLYTSGTTGDPKGVVLSHRNAFYEAAAVDLAAPTPMHAASIAYLPLAHIGERELGIYRAAYKALHVTVCADPAQVVPALARTRPPAFFGVPRVWEKLAAGLRMQVGALAEPQRSAILRAHAVAAEAFRVEGSGGTLGAERAAALAEAEQAVLRPLRTRLGLEELRWASSGSAPIPVEVLEYLAGFGIRVLEVWGMSETTGCATVNRPDAFRVGAVGRAIPGVDVRLADDGEILVRGPIVFLGYLDADGRIAPAVDEDGWLATGDIGTFDADGFLTITDRKKELLITSSGKNIAPSKIEGLLRAHPLVGQAVAVGDRRPYVTALITLDEEAAPLWAKAQGLAAVTAGELAAEPAVRDELDRLVQTVNERLARAEQIKRYELLPQTWSPESGELTPTLKLRRRVILDRYADEIAGLYTPAGVAP
ncbi:long-chain fatty acid--CoA ligase [Frankia sp. CNm7]|uniref:AMP-dependent synthetase/ligase n=1 Tax=Frankia nepalensis TaxID=1836974 RepID=UPI001D2EA26E|nr:long-chain fatty acid--CoA ligase [Frankia nepalensis]MBL7513489.1 long-chain fatty acid--CoA ligase [Frankia nepalensis]MBL7521845.1 long-chain fatty acid--CoA ligase [Frankia nepalensis]